MTLWDRLFATAFLGTAGLLLTYAYDHLRGGPGSLLTAATLAGIALLLVPLYEATARPIRRTGRRHQLTSTPFVPAQPLDTIFVLLFLGFLLWLTLPAETRAQPVFWQLYGVTCVISMLRTKPPLHRLWQLRRALAGTVLECERPLQPGSLFTARIAPVAGPLPAGTLCWLAQFPRGKGTPEPALVLRADSVVLRPLSADSLQLKGRVPRIGSSNEGTTPQQWPARWLILIGPALESGSYLVSYPVELDCDSPLPPSDPLSSSHGHPGDIGSSSQARTGSVAGQAGPSVPPAG